ncbi:MAG TPA: epoxyqueuosine reductase QueH [Methylomusa anaerophila]|uniref:Epoxyqueuosine reductase QueH n=1 Tax=Methylomusa anaerophila TaxID=1930071 RepID=A0A348AP63_9FIRM|nr:epoxyqueuosine reductase QueH [Methylomusa anaerophila]BBB92861.1 hypothetical protein MAMMFC1_03569 [Methylomusa anaerophila]HML87303.1 epoxyqueuosine reductase QueH [Methylomusa anaerophila]
MTTDQTRKKMLLHICCGPCAVYPVQHLRENYSEYDIIGYFYNPNIHPYKEFAKRLETLKTYAQDTGLELLTDERYALEDYLLRVFNAQQGRCHECYYLRLRQTAQYGKVHGFDCFTTTLLVSPYQQHEMIKEVAEQVSQDEGIAFQYIDFRPGWTEGVKISRDRGMYRQPYCGCIFSEKERYYKPQKE